MTPTGNLTNDLKANIAALRAGDSQTCERFVRDNAPRMLAVARRMLRCEEDAADALQDAFLSAFKAIHSFDGESLLSTWLHRIVVNACLMKLRSQGRRPSCSIEDHLPRFAEDGHHAARIARWPDDVVEKASSQEMRHLVRECIDELPEPYRAVLILRDIEQMDTIESAKALNCTPANLKTRLHRARQALRTILEERFGQRAEPLVGVG